MKVKLKNPHQKNKSSCKKMKSEEKTLNNDDFTNQKGRLSLKHKLEEIQFKLITLLFQFQVKTKHLD